MDVSAKKTTATVRYQVTAVERSVAFYTKHLGFKLDKRTGRSRKSRAAASRSS